MEHPMEHSMEARRASMQRQVSEANRMFQRVLGSWASDVLELRRRDLLVPRWESSPSSTDCQGHIDDEPMMDAA